MLRRTIGRILRPNPLLASFGVLVSLIGGWKAVSLFRTDARWAMLGDLSTSELAGLLGLLFIVLLITRSLISDLRNLFVHEKRVVCGSGQAGTAYDYENLLGRDPKEVFVVAQNMRTLLSDANYLPCISRWLARNKKRELNLTFILSTPKALGSISRTARDHLKQTVVDLRNFLMSEEMSHRITVRFHSGASSLSAIVCDPKSKRRGILVFTPKWAHDAQPANRLYCVIERWEHDELFNLIAGTIPAMTQNDSMDLGEVCTELKLEPIASIEVENNVKTEPV